MQVQQRCGYWYPTSSKAIGLFRPGYASRL